MRDLETPPFIVGDTAYGAPAPGGFASAAAVPNTYPADVAYTAPALGGEFQPGQSQLITTKGAPADGGAAQLLALANAPPAPPVPAPLEVAVAIAANELSATVALSKGPAGPAAQSFDISLTIDALAPQTATIVIPLGTSLSAASVMMRTALEAMTFVTTAAIAGSAQFNVLVETGHTIEALTIVTTPVPP